MRDLRDFDGLAVLVTGGSLGIGAAACRLFAARGANVAIASRDAEAGTALAAEIERAGGRAIHVAADIAEEEQVRAMVRATVDAFGGLDVLVNNAGIHRTGDAGHTTLADWQQVMAVNLTGAFLATREALPHLAERSGRIVNVASEAGRVGIAGQVAYNASKAGMISLTQSCAVDFAPRGVRVACVCPGTTHTPLVEAALAAAEDREGLLRRLEGSRPANRLGTADEIASAIAYLASDDAAFATGAVLSVDGGYTAQ